MAKSYLPQDRLNPDDKDIIAKKKMRALRALQSCNGVVEPAFRLAGIFQRYHYFWMDEDPEYRRAVEFIKEGVLDHVETKMFERINGVLHTNEGEDDEMPIKEFLEGIPDDIDINTPEGEEWLKQRRIKLGMDKLKIYRKPPSEAMIRFYLESQGRKRGYTNRTELTGADGASLFTGKTDAELLSMIQEINKKLD
jgi:hypothetical protein